VKSLPAPALSPETGLLLSRAFGLNDGFWVGLQQDYDLARARDKIAAKLEEVEACA
jgi:plasmid maintenance system antidote protein VapI